MKEIFEKAKWSAAILFLIQILYRFSDDSLTTLSIILTIGVVAKILLVKGYYTMAKMYNRMQIFWGQIIFLISLISFVYFIMFLNIKILVIINFIILIIGIILIIHGLTKIPLKRKSYLIIGYSGFFLPPFGWLLFFLIPIFEIIVFNDIIDSI